MRKPYNGRDWLILRLVQGATKSGTHIDRKKESKRRECRRRIRKENTNEA